MTDLRALLAVFLLDKKNESLGFSLDSLPTFLIQTSLARLILSDLSALLDGVCHHFLFFESLSNVVPVEAKIALLT